MLQAAIHTVFQCWCYTLYEHSIPAEGLYQGQHSSAHLCVKQCATPQMVPYAKSVSTGHSMSMCKCSSNYRQDGTAQLFVAYGGRVRGKPISKQRLSNWLVERIKFAYEKHNLPVPEGGKGHQTHKMAVTYTDMAGANRQTICEAAMWQTTSTLAKFYRLDAIANTDTKFGRRVLTLAGSSTLVQLHWDGYHIPWKQHFRW